MNPSVKSMLKINVFTLHLKELLMPGNRVAKSGMGNPWRFLEVYEECRV